MMITNNYWKVCAKDLTESIRNNIKHNLIVFGIRTVNMVLVTLQDDSGKKRLELMEEIVKGCDGKNGRSTHLYCFTLLHNNLTAKVLDQCGFSRCTHNERFCKRDINIFHDFAISIYLLFGCLECLAIRNVFIYIHV